MGSTETKVKTPTPNRTRTFKSKSERVRSLLDEGKTIAEITRIVPGMGYAFAYGIAKRYGKSDTAANRRATKTINVVDNRAHCRIVDPEGNYQFTLVVDLQTGKTTRQK